ncbi:Uncharacterised protein [Pandoraea pulmonicola]|uniref:Uncharacterized protein n=1 Tax=Pandoraea pulmonicola TaxID=93221 RepID=A0AAJ4Z8I8_PANPU|nr:Uncharacterised protein [Pandoraea pulmonicola]
MGLPYRSVFASLQSRENAPRAHEKKGAEAPQHGSSKKDVSDRYCCAPPLNQAAIFWRSSSVIWVTLPSGIDFSATAC